MPISTAADMNAYIDNLCRAYFRQLGLTTNTYGTGAIGSAYAPSMSSGALLAADALQTAILATLDPDVSNDLLTSSINAIKATDAIAVVGNQFNQFIQALTKHVKRLAPVATVKDIDSYLTYLNTVSSPNSALQHPAWLPIFQQFANAVPSPINLYFPVLVGGTYLGTTYATALGEFTGGTFTAGFAVDTTKYSGGLPYLDVTALTGTGTVTVTGTSVSWNGTARVVTTGSTWTASVTTTGEVALTPGGTQPAPANSLIAAVTNVTDTGVSSITCYVEAHAPSGRLSVP